MKKIKLITGLSALSALTIGTLPLTSCNKNTFDGKVTEAEWKKAMEIMVTPGSNWCFGQEGDYFAGGDYESESSYAIVSYNQWISNDQGSNLKGLQYTPNKEPYPMELFIKNLDGGFGYQKMTQTRGTTTHTQHIISINQALAAWTMIFYSMYDNQSSFTFDKDGYYTFAGMLEQVLITNTKIKFGSDRRIQHLVISATISRQSSQELFAFDIHFDYSKKEIKFEDDFLERVNKHCYKMDNTESIKFDPTVCEKQHEGLFFSIVPPTGKTYNTLSFLDKQGQIVNLTDEVQITSNSVMLVEDTDFKINQDGTITITDGFTNKDQICISIDPDYFDNQYTLKIS